MCNTWAFKEKGLHPLGMCGTAANLLKQIPKKQTKYPKVFSLLKIFFQEEDQKNIILYLRGNDPGVQKKAAQEVTSRLCIHGRGYHYKCAERNQLAQLDP